MKNKNYIMKTKKTTEKLRLMRWANDGYPPIDLNNEFEAVLELLDEIKKLRLLLPKKLKYK